MCYIQIRSNLLVNQDIEQVDNLFIITNFTIQPSKIQVQLKAFWGRLKMGMRIGDENEHPKEVWKEYLPIKWELDFHSMPQSG